VDTGSPAVPGSLPDGALLGQSPPSVPACSGRTPRPDVSAPRRASLCRYCHQVLPPTANIWGPGTVPMTRLEPTIGGVARR